MALEWHLEARSFGLALLPSPWPRRPWLPYLGSLGRRDERFTPYFCIINYRLTGFWISQYFYTFPGLGPEIR